MAALVYLTLTAPSQRELSCDGGLVPVRLNNPYFSLKAIEEGLRAFSIGFIALFF